DRQQRDRDQAGGEDHDRQHRGEDRPVDEESGEVHGVFLARPSGTRRWEWGARPRAWRGWRIASEALADPPRERGGTGRIGGLCTAAGVARRGGSVVTARARLRARASAACRRDYFIATACSGAGASSPMAMVFGATGMPGMNTFCTPCTITLSFA